jgi:hypothetical protein
VRYPPIGVGYGGFGLFFDPFWHGFGYSNFGYGYAYSPFSYPYYGPGEYGDPFDTTGPTGSIRLNVQPTSAEVYVDGYYAGIVDDFDGHFQHLNLTPGPHHIEITAPGFQPLTVDVVIEPHRKIDYRGRMEQ